MSFRINRVYTRSGDGGETGLVGGERVRKSDLRVCAYGDVDELNAALGLVHEAVEPKFTQLRELIEFLQQELFDLGAELATPPDQHYPGMWNASQDHIDRLERLCDYFGGELPELHSFILPGGSDLAARLHVARTVCRRAERTLVSLQERANPSPVSGFTIIYLNRVSDLLFVLSRWVLKEQGRDTPLWTKGELRSLSFLK